MIKINNKSRFNTLLFVLSPILSVYSTGITGFGIGDLALGLIILTTLISKKKNTVSTTLSKCDTELVAFVFYAVVVSMGNLIVNGYSISDVAKRNLVMFFYVTVIIVLMYDGVLDKEYAIKYYSWSAIVCSVVIFIQVFSHYLLGYNTFFLIPNLIYNQSTLANYSMYTSHYNYMYSYSFRPTSIFLEPSHFSLYVAPYLGITLNTKDLKNKQLFVALFLSIAIVFSTSLTGYLLVGICWLIFIYHSFSNGKIKKKHLVIIFISLIIIIIFIMSSDYYTVLKARLSGINNGQRSSTNERLVKGFDFIKQLEPIECFFGIGCGSYNSYVSQNTFLDNMFQNEYMNSISYIFVSTGFIGSFLFIMYSKALWNTLNNNKFILLLLLAMYISGSVLFSSWDVFLLVFGLLLSKSSLIDSKDGRMNNLNKVL